MAVAHVQTTKTIDNNVDTTTTTSAITLTAGNLLLCGIAEFRAAAIPNAPTGAQLDGTTSLTQDITLAETDTARRVSFYSLADVPGGSHTVTVTYDLGPNRVAVYLMEVSGAAIASYQDGAGTGTDYFFPDTTTPDSGSFAASLPTDFWVSLMVSSATANPATVTAGAGWTIPTNGSETDGSANAVSGIEYIANPGTNTENGQWTITSSRAATIIFAYKAAAAAGTDVGGWGPREVVQRRQPRVTASGYIPPITSYLESMRRLRRVA